MDGGNNMVEDEVYKQREYVVAKSNAIVQRSRYALSAAEQRAMAYIISKIKPTDKSYQLNYQIDISQYGKVCGLPDNGTLYNKTKTLLKGLRDKSMWLKTEDGHEVVVGWLRDVDLNPSSGIVCVSIDKRLAPYLFDLKQRFVSYGLIYYLALRSKYAQRLYELFKSYLINKKCRRTIALQVLYQQLDITAKYKYKDLRVNVLDVATREINDCTDISVSYQPIKTGRTVTAIEIQILLKEPLDRYTADVKANAYLDRKISPQTRGQLEFDQYGSLTEL